MAGVENNEDDWETDEDDDEYVPPQGAVSDEEISDQGSDDESEDEENPALANPGHKRNGKTKKKGKKRCKTELEMEESDNKNQTVKLTQEDEKKKMDSLWADFLGDDHVTSKTSDKTNLTEKASEDKPISKKPLTPEKTEKVKVKELFEFAGETVEVEKEIIVTSPEAKTNFKENLAKTTSSSSNNSSPNSSSKRQAAAGIGNLIQQIGSKKNKLSVLDKTKLDWNSFKKEEGIEEDLKTHNKGKDGYLEKMEFLQRTDLRQFEIEKRIRTINRSHKS